MKIVIITDLEGPSGINGRSDGKGNRTVNSPIACQVLTEEVNACVEGLLEAGATEIIVWDGHGGSNSIDITRLHPVASLATIGGDLAPCVYSDASFDAAIQLGAHAMAGVMDGYMNHSYDSHSVVRMLFNGEPIGEIGVEAYREAYFRVPTILVSGDAAACREAKALLGESLPTVETKNAISRYTVVNRNPVQVREELKKTAKEALQRLDEFKVLELPSKMDFVIEFMCANIANQYEKWGAERVDAQTVRFESDDFVDLFSRYGGWASGVHNRRFQISPERKGLF